MNTLPLFAARILLGATVRVTRLSSTETVIDRIEADEESAEGFRIVAAAISLPGIVGFDSETATAWPTDAEIESHVVGALAEIEVDRLKAWKDHAKASVTSRRWDVETSGITLGGVDIRTDDRSKLLLTNVDRQARRDSDFTTEWKGANGVFVPLTAVQIIAIADAVFAHVSVCFAREAELHALIDACGTIEAVKDLDPVIIQFTA